MKDKTTALILSILVGAFGVDRFYLGYTGMGILKLLTGGCFGILWLIDLINIATGRLQPADGSPYKDDAPASPPVNAAEELSKFKELLDQGVITQAEYQLKKSQLMKLL